MCTADGRVFGSVAEALRMTRAGLDYLNGPAGADLDAAACGLVLRSRGYPGRFRGIDAQPVTGLITGMFAGDTTGILAFQRVAGNAHELDTLNAGLRKIQARLSATEDDGELDALVAERKAAKARIKGFAVVPDSFDYAPTGQTVVLLRRSSP